MAVPEKEAAALPGALQAHRQAWDVPDLWTSVATVIAFLALLFVIIFITVGGGAIMPEHPRKERKRGR